MGNTGILIRVRVLTENEDGGVVKVGRDETLREALRKLERIVALRNAEALGNFRRVGTEDCVRVNWAEAQRLPRLDRLVGGDRGS